MTMTTTTQTQPERILAHLQTHGMSSSPDLAAALKIRTSNLGKATGRLFKDGQIQKVQRMVNVRGEGFGGRFHYAIRNYWEIMPLTDLKCCGRVR